MQMVKADGCFLRNVKGSHHIIAHLLEPGHLSIPHPKKYLGIGLVNKLLKLAGLK